MIKINNDIVVCVTYKDQPNVHIITTVMSCNAVYSYTCMVVKHFSNTIIYRSPSLCLHPVHTKSVT